MAAGNNLSGRQFFHGTNAVLSEGDALNPQHEPSTFPEQTGHVYMTQHPEKAQYYADYRAKTHGGEPKVYQVKPVGRVEIDPESEYAKHDSQIMHRAKGATVIGEYRG